MNMNIRMTVTNHFTQEVIIDSTITGLPANAWPAAEHNQRVFAKQYPDCYVNMFEVGGNSFIFGVPYNQEQDEIAVDNGHMTFREFQNKWYADSFSPLDDDIPAIEIERQIDMLLEQDWDQRDSVCH